MIKDKLFTDKMYLVHRTTGKKFLLASHCRSGWFPDVLQIGRSKSIEVEDLYVNMLSEFLRDTYNQHKCILKNYDHFKIDAKQYSIEFESDK